MKKIGIMLFAILFSVSLLVGCKGFFDFSPLNEDELNSDGIQASTEGTTGEIDSQQEAADLFSNMRGNGTQTVPTSPTTIDSEINVQQ